MTCWRFTEGYVTDYYEMEFVAIEQRRLPPFPVFVLR